MLSMSTLKPTNGGETQNYHHGNLREALIKNGLDLLESTQGTEFSMRELTRRIGVSANAVYRHFANKEQLLIGLAIDGFKQLLTVQAEAIQNTPDPQDRFINSGREYVKFAIKHPSLFRLMYGRFAVSHDDEALKNMANLAYNGILYAGAGSLSISPDSIQAKILATKAWSLVHGLSSLIIDGQFGSLKEDDLNNIIDTVLEGDYKSP